MPRKRELTWQPGTDGRQGRWKKKYKGRTPYLGVARAKSDRDAYRQALDVWHRRKAEIDAEEAALSLSHADPHHDRGDVGRGTASSDGFHRRTFDRRGVGHDRLRHSAAAIVPATFLVVEPDVMSCDELQESLGELLYGTERPTIRIPKTVAEAGAWVEERLSSECDQPFIKPWMIELADDHYEATINRPRAVLGWEPEHRLRDTLPRTVEFFRDVPRGFYEENKLPLPKDFAGK